MTHTPGPWEWDWNHSDALYNAEFLKLDRQVREFYKSDKKPDKHLEEQRNYHPYNYAIVETDNRCYGPKDPDARLIAAAPDLLAALESITNEVERRGMCINMATNDVLAIAFRDARAAIAKAEGK